MQPQRKERKDRIMLKERTNGAQFKALLKKVQQIMVDAIDTLPAGEAFDLSIHPGRSFRGDNPDHAINVSISPFVKESSFSFYCFYSVEENQKELDKLRAYLKTRKESAKTNEDVFK